MSQVLLNRSIVGYGDKGAIVEVGDWQADALVRQGFAEKVETPDVSEEAESDSEPSEEPEQADVANEAQQADSAAPAPAARARKATAK